ncbi:hypothetical protein KB221_13305 [Aquidulcibacter paucihalophilus]|jgi:hypothetical protein|nr:hypothetical protein KB221_13305 [Aquidulcibacter paucihalophilus]
MAEPTFTLEIERNIEPDRLAWIDGEDAADGTGLGCNRDYRDLRSTTWAEVDEILEIELCRLDQSEVLGFMDSHEIHELDVGVAGAAFALAAAGCIPFTSCNGGALGGRHSEEYPLVAFYLPKLSVERILWASEKANAGLFQDPVGGTVHVYGCQLRDLHAFARALHDSRLSLA